MTINGVEYVTGRDRNEEKAVAHLYRGTFAGVGNPMCVRGWNRSNGSSYSIFRNLPNIRLCKVCMRRAKAGLEPVESRDRETKWI